MLFVLRLVDFEARGQQEFQWQADEGFRQYVSLLIELGYQPSDIERELLSTWTANAEAAEAEGDAAAAGQPPENASRRWPSPALCCRVATDR